MKPLSTRTANFTDSVIRRMTRISNKYGAINLSQGFPDFDPPKEITDRLAEIAPHGPHQYAITWGAQNFREALAKKQSHFTGLDIDPDKNIVATHRHLLRHRDALHHPLGLPLQLADLGTTPELFPCGFKKCSYFCKPKTANAMDEKQTYTERQKQLALIAKALGHPARIAIMQFLARQEQCYFGDIHEELPIAKATVSQHLAELKKAGLIQGTIETPKVRYCINPDGWQLARTLLADFFAFLLQLKWWDWDIEKIERNFKALSSGDLSLIRNL